LCWNDWAYSHYYALGKEKNEIHLNLPRVHQMVHQQPLLNTDKRPVPEPLTEFSSFVWRTIYEDHVLPLSTLKPDLPLFESLLRGGVAWKTAMKPVEQEEFFAMMVRS